MQDTNKGYKPIEDYGLIGNMKTVALVSIEGSIDFMCYPDFDSPSVFAKLLDHQKGGSFSIIPQIKDFKTKQLYLPATAVLLTRFFSEEGIAELTDYMPINLPGSQKTNTIVRMIKTVRGSITYRVKCDPAFNYARAKHKCDLKENEIRFTTQEQEPTIMRLISDIPLQILDNCGYAEFTLEQSEVAFIVLECGQDEKPNAIDFYKNNTYQQTIDFWRAWTKKSTYKGRWSETINRSAITLKLLTSIEQGSTVAAPTFSLPETLGAGRNWDYRYTWIRDAAFTMYAFLRLGYTDEATAFLKWIHDRSSEDKLYLMYTINGKHNLAEKELEHFEGYKNSLPVRIGNAAQDQLQIDIYGELIDTVYIYNKQHSAITFEFWETIVTQIEQVIENWQKADHGIWEIRNIEKEFLHSRLMCWVAMDRAIKIAENRSFPYPEKEWKNIRNEIYKDIYHNFWNEKLGAWVQYKGAEQVDASVLLMSLMHFISPYEPRWLSTMKVVERELGLDVLLYRYRNGPDEFDGLQGDEGTFNMCSFWYIESLAKSGEVTKALDSFEKMIAYANHLGLFSEQISHKAEHLGNFPQAFTHLALISAALEIDKQLDRM
ncbi:Glucoamylase (glucan-1,4-alpha-glucosidase), GH15 family [Dyadobacter koreensis]|uniref:Glucoamylase (Glucan-1,4-alpha-glucosidase), GH15 family n=1 Tax=Dyadobacter koreensis TaxID=408657 RepID=A0A1H6QBZ4_9BACT|nr:glycoside hydrolase family 15 protein [Dyadobacter koreensis]SEI37140.1 Glucoamylase (glucan-1,4-alpha-glucosidase), GH15 family [Dyadobacter koreensis]